MRTASGLLMGELEGVSGGKVEWSNAASVKSSGNLTVKDRGQTVDWVSWLFQPIYIVDGQEYPLGVFTAAVPTDDWDDDGRVWDVELMDRTSILDRTSLETTYSVAAGTNIVTAVKTVIELSGISAGTITESDATVRGNLVWEAGTSLLKVANELLESANFFSLSCDGDGDFQLIPYVEPGRRPVAFEFTDGEGGVRYLSKFSSTRDIYSIPNRVIAVSQDSADVPALSAVARNENPESPYSFQSRGRWVDETITGVEAADQATLDAYARRRLVELSSATATRVISHLFEGLTINEVGRFVSSRAGIDALHAITKTEVPLNETGLVKTTLREVAEV